MVPPSSGLSAVSNCGADCFGSGKSKSVSRKKYPSMTHKYNVWISLSRGR